VSGCAFISRIRSTLPVRPWTTWTKPASSEPPPNPSATSVESWKVTSPVYSSAISAHHRPCSWRSLLRRAASSDSKRTSVMQVPSGVTPAVEPSHPVAVGASLVDPPLQHGAYGVGVGDLTLNHLNEHVASRAVGH
jgi:hypothetical protein